MAKYDYMKLARKRTWSEKELMAFKKFISQDGQAADNALNEFHNNPLILLYSYIFVSMDQQNYNNKIDLLYFHKLILV